MKRNANEHKRQLVVSDHHRPWAREIAEIDGALFVLQKKIEKGRRMGNERNNKRPEDQQVSYYYVTLFESILR